MVTEIREYAARSVELSERLGMENNPQNRRDAMRTRSFADALTRVADGNAGSGDGERLANEADIRFALDDDGAGLVFAAAAHIAEAGTIRETLLVGSAENALFSRGDDSGIRNAADARNVLRAITQGGLVWPRAAWPASGTLAEIKARGSKSAAVYARFFRREDQWAAIESLVDGLDTRERALTLTQSFGAWPYFNFEYEWDKRWEC